MQTGAAALTGAKAAALPGADHEVGGGMKAASATMLESAMRPEESRQWRESG